MNLELNVVGLANEDVIATSCNSVWGVAYFAKEEDNYTRFGFQNGTNGGNINEARFLSDDDIATKPDGFVGEGYYHVNEYGTIIEKCPHSVADSGNNPAVLEAHGIDLSDLMR